MLNVPQSTTIWGLLNYDSLSGRPHPLPHLRRRRNTHLPHALHSFLTFKDICFPRHRSGLAINPTWLQWGREAFKLLGVLQPPPKAPATPGYCTFPCSVLFHVNPPLHQCYQRHAGGNVGVAPCLFIRNPLRFESDDEWLTGESDTARYPHIRVEYWETGLRPLKYLCDLSLRARSIYPYEEDGILLEFQLLN